MEIIEVTFGRQPCKFGRYLSEAKEIEARWMKSGLLNGITDRFTRQVTAVILESQRLVNEK